MISFFTYRINRFAAYLSIICFVVGSLLFLLQTTFKGDTLLSTGLVFIILAVMTNIITLFISLANAFMHSKDFKEHIYAIMLLIFNIPVALFYLNNLNI